ncbi:Cystathionine beta-synthase, putative [Pediculus humanus corporis]|uniref:Cystathionine beta-synthase n=1 Tax=Pediculus humanus subsp. corporis TaxID=121224 RepID=E0VV90_PEDHC|nr:Cystathionine beta-synthase, putative [Pediculus humanus corporis]EEB17296.1 Cystathionine beta-synthase, putative [Pediculus humanus corporis]
MTEIKYQPLAPISSEKLIEGGEKLNFIRPDTPSRCTWKPGLNSSSSPHNIKPLEERLKILPNVLHAVGNTPLIKLNRIPNSYGIKCEMLAKCEFFNPAGSVKDRIAIRMIEDAEMKGLLKPGSTIIEPTSGNTGLGLAMGAAVKGYRCIIVMPLKMSNEKVNALKALGAEVIRTPTSASFDSPEGLIAVAQKLSKEIPNSIILDQYRNAYNPIAHYEHTAEEILSQCNRKVDAIVCGAGTGGTACGIGRKIKDVLPSCKVIAADPLGSSLSLPPELNKSDVTFYEVEGIGYDFIPTVLDRSVIDEWHKTNDKDSLLMARRLIREEGLLCGGSSGSAMTVAIKVAKKMKEGERLVVILPDGMRNYMSKFIIDSWMKIRKFNNDGIEEIPWWSNLPVSVLKMRTPPTVTSTSKCSDAIKIMKEMDLDYLFVIKEKEIIGVVSTNKILNLIADSTCNLENTVEKFLDPVQIVNNSVSLDKICLIFQTEKFVLINGAVLLQIIFNSNELSQKFITSSDLLHFINGNENTQ